MYKSIEIPFIKIRQSYNHQGGCLNIKMSSYHYRDLHAKDKTVSRPSYL